LQFILCGFQPIEFPRLGLIRLEAFDQVLGRRQTEHEMSRRWSSVVSLAQILRGRALRRHMFKPLRKATRGGCEMQRRIVAGWMAAPLVTALVWAGGAQAQQLFVYPQRGQSTEQQKRDQFECHQWAVQQSGVDPTAPKTAQAPPPAPPPQGARGGPSAGRGAARGAAVGAVGGAIAGEAGTGAAVGAATGALFGGMRKADAHA
jgi:hypothetical protein